MPDYFSRPGVEPLGRTVYYTTINNEVFPAMIVAFYDDNSLDLQVFTNKLDGSQLYTNVRYDETGRVMSWYWSPHAGKGQREILTLATYPN